MNSVIIDWRFVVTFGAATVGIIFAVKMSPKDAAAVSIHAIDAYKDYAIATNSLC